MKRKFLVIIFTLIILVGLSLTLYFYFKRTKTSQEIVFPATCSDERCLSEESIDKEWQAEIFISSKSVKQEDCPKDLQAKIFFIFDINEQDQIKGFGFGKYLKYDCFISDCSFEIDVSDFKVDVLGEFKEDKFYLRLAASPLEKVKYLCKYSEYEREDYHLFSALEYSGGLDFEIEAKDGAKKMLKYQFPSGGPGVEGEIVLKKR